MQSLKIKMLLQRCFALEDAILGTLTLEHSIVTSYVILSNGRSYVYWRQHILNYNIPLRWLRMYKRQRRHKVNVGSKTKTKCC